MRSHFTPAELAAYLDEALPSEAMAAVEAGLRARPEMAEELLAVLRRRDAGVHSLGEIWRRHRLSCPNRQDLANDLLGILAPEISAYLKFHLEEVGCRYCLASLEDLKRQQSDLAAAPPRRHRYFQSSAPLLKRK